MTLFLSICAIAMICTWLFLILRANKKQVGISERREKLLIEYVRICQDPDMDPEIKKLVQTMMEELHRGS